MRGTITHFYRTHGQKGLRELANSVGTTEGYLVQLSYNPKKRPSVGLAKKLIDASGGEITLDGICNPIKTLKQDW